MEILFYLLKVNMALAMFYLVYRLCYRNDTYFTLRRYLLLALLIVSATYPLLDVSHWVKQNASFNEATVAYIQYLPEFISTAYLSEVTVTSSEITTQSIPFEKLLLGIYAVITGFFLLRLAFRLYKIIVLRLRCIPVEVNNQQA